MDLHRFRAQQGTFSPSNSTSTNPDIASHGSNSSPTGIYSSPAAQTPTLIYTPNPLVPLRGILKSVPWGTEETELQSQSQSQQSHSESNSYASPLASPSCLLPHPPGAIGAGGIGGVGYGGGYGGGVGWTGTGGEAYRSGRGWSFVNVKSTRKMTPYRGLAYTPTRPSTGRLSRLTIGDPNRECGFWCWFMFLFACCAILGLGSMWLFQVLIFAPWEGPRK